MGKQYSEISSKLQVFIQQQKIFFVGTATQDSRVNISPKGMDSFKVIDQNTIAWLNVTGSANETSAHIQQMPRMTIMFVSFEGKPMILRLYGEAKVIHKNDARWEEMYAMFTPIAGARQIFEMRVDLVQTSCGMSIPFFEYKQEREELSAWAEKAGEKGIKEYWEKNNQLSLDDQATNIMQLNT